MSGLTLGIIMVAQLASVVVCALVCRYYLKRCKDFADDANDAAHDAYNYVAGLQTPTDTEIETPETGHDEAEPDRLSRAEDPTLFIPTVRDHHFREDDPDVLLTHGQQLRAATATGKHHLADPHDHHPRRR
jgi:hypothetical protein